MISRQTLEHMHNSVKNKSRVISAQSGEIRGRYNEARASADTEEKQARVKQLYDEFQKIEYERFTLEITEQVYRHLLDHVDVKTPPDLEVVGNMAVKSG